MGIAETRKIKMLKLASKTIRRVDAVAESNIEEEEEVMRKVMALGFRREFVLQYLKVTGLDSIQELTEIVRLACDEDQETLETIASEVKVSTEEG